MKSHATDPKNQKRQVPPLATTLLSSDSLAGTGTALSGAQVLTTNNSLGLLDNLLALGQDQLDVAGV